MNERLLDLLRSVLGEYKELNGGEFSFKSPFKRHRKKKLQIQLDPKSERFGYWNDWITENSGKSLFSLFKKLDVSQKKFDRLSDLVDRPDYNFSGGKSEDKEEHGRVTLPSEFTPLWEKQNTPEYKHARKHIANRGLTKYEIIKYQIGYCEAGEYKNRIVVPSFDLDGRLNYFVARTFFEDFLKYKNPSHPKDDLIGFENLLSWNYPVVITEGAFDAIAVRRNSIPLFGSQLSDGLLRKIVEEKPPEIIIALDSDAKSKALKMAQKLLDFEVDVSIVNFPEETDPSDHGFEKVWSFIEKRDPVNFENLVRFKLIDS